jgi:hypothetical protein
MLVSRATPVAAHFRFQKQTCAGDFECPLMAFIGFSSASPQFRKVLANAKRRVIVYIAVSSKIINGSPANSIDVVPAQPWPQTP